jgi:hypothetical protein
VLPFLTVGQAVIRAAGDWIGAQGASEVGGLGHDTGLGIKFQLGPNLVAGLHAGGVSVGGAEAKEEAARMMATLLSTTYVVRRRSPSRSAGCDRAGARPADPSSKARGAAAPAARRTGPAGPIGSPYHA